MLELQELETAGVISSASKRKWPSVASRSSSWKIPDLFGRYNRAWMVLIAIVLTELVGGTYLAARYFNLGPWELLISKTTWGLLPAWLIIPLVWLGFATAKVVRQRAPRPSLTLLRLIRFRKKWLIRGAILFACYFPMARAFAVLKSAIPNITTYYLDPFLVKLDIAMLGADAWKISHILFPDPFIYFIDRVYLLWFTYVLLLAGWFCFSKNEHMQIRGTLALNLCWVVLGGFGAVLAASVGPCFHGRHFPGGHFDDLISTINAAHSDRGLMARVAMDFLINNHGTGRFGAGISAMPSMHVSMAFLGFLATLTYANIWLKIFTGTFTALIVIGSVHLGWHYLSDGLVSLLATAIIWSLTGRLVARLDTRAAAPKGGHLPKPLAHRRIF